MSSKCAVVLIDDNEVDLFLHEQLLLRAGSFGPVWSFTNPRRALDHLASLPYIDPTERYPIVLLLDIKMPDMDGFSFLDRLDALPASLRRRCHVVLLSATLQIGDTIRAEAHPSVEAFVTKPLTITKLAEIATLVA
ncbi:response regulator [Dinghuibacter silviterrae]|uniref:Response regulator receiver domain-containing protein n=1 Tax=Dinghuibacter silviterrae TaxID=1539049 RepID=A0A4R8DVM4_9BACT|nr:response regulator [Dinghuibacter silviterrae]TDX02249.1 response regulator receiver domain-containing protein [Dinghuibacter silviterrae]